MKHLSLSKVPPTDLEGDRKVVIAHTCVNDSFIERFASFSDWMKLLRAVAWLKRFCKYIQDHCVLAPQHRLRLQSEEIRLASRTIVMLNQRASFEREIRVISLNSTSGNSQGSKGLGRSLRSLSPLLDEGLLRVGGRLKWASLPFEAKHPAVLPDKRFVTTLIIRYYHERSGHVGPIQVLASIRERFWIIRGLAAVKKDVRRCSHCIRWFSRPCQ